MSAGVVGLALLLGLGGLVLLGGCRTSVASRNGTAVANGDTLHGRMVAGRREQAFTFEGVESSLVDFVVQADTGNQAAPVVEVLDPEGRSLDVVAATTSSPGSATMRVRSLPLTKTGTYKVIARPASSCETVFYRFNHCVRFAPICDRKSYLSVDKPRPVYVSAPRGGLIVCEIDPLGGDLQPDILAVKDPWGGPALDKSLVPKGANPPRVSHMQNRTMILTFTAPRPGMYTILAGAKPCKPGVGKIHVEVRTPRGCQRNVYHCGAAPGDFGLPAPPPTEPSRACPPPRPTACPPPQPPCVVPPTTCPDPALAGR